MEDFNVNLKNALLQVKHIMNSCNQDAYTQLWALADVLLEDPNAQIRPDLLGNDPPKSA